MGYMRHHAIVVTCDTESVEIVRKIATDVFSGWKVVSEAASSPMNNYSSFFIAPDGSKEGWSTSEDGDSKRALFIQELRRIEGDRIYADWVEVQYGDDDCQTIVTDHSDAPAPPAEAQP